MSTMTPDRFIIREETGREVGRETRLGVARKIALQLARTHRAIYRVVDSISGSNMGTYGHGPKRQDGTPPEAMRRKRR